MTPAIRLAKKAKIDYRLHEYSHDSSADSYGLEAAQKLGVQSERVFKTLVVEYEVNKFGIGVVPVTAQLSLKSIAKALGGKKANMAQPHDVEKITGYVLGGVSPLGQKRALKTVIDSSANLHETLFVSGGKRGLEIELSPSDLLKLTNGNYAQIQG